jgi:opacity protein-like surface antigen
MKKTILATALATVIMALPAVADVQETTTTTIMVADVAPVQSGIKADGPYVGLSVGMSNTFGKHTVLLDGRENVNHPGEQGVAGQLFAGYGRFSGPLYMGIEVRGGYDTGVNTYKITNPENNELLKYELKRGWNAGIGPRFGRGIFNDQALVYVRVMADWQWLKLKAPNVFGDDKYKTFNSFKITPGIGIEGAINEKMTARLEFDYAIGVQTRTYTKTNDADNSIKVNSNSTAIRVGIAYKY